MRNRLTNVSRWLAVVLALAAVGIYWSPSRAQQPVKDKARATNTPEELRRVVRDLKDLVPTLKQDLDQARKDVREQTTAVVREEADGPGGRRLEDLRKELARRQKAFDLLARTIDQLQFLAAQ